MSLPKHHQGPCGEFIGWEQHCHRCGYDGWEHRSQNYGRIPAISENTGIPTSLEVSGLKGDHEGLIVLNTRVENSMLTKRNALRLALRLVKYVIKEMVGM